MTGFLRIRARSMSWSWVLGTACGGIGSEDFENSDNFKKLKALDIPVIFMDWMLDDANVSFITPNDFIGGFRATQYLVDAGHQRIGFIGPYDKGAAVKRLQGYKKALKKAGLEPEKTLIKLYSLYSSRQ